MIVKPILDFMQSMPALAYLVPAIVMFSVGIVPGAFATIIFAMPPGVRLTELAIRQVDGEKVEAGQAFGATPSHILVQDPAAARDGDDHGRHQPGHHARSVDGRPRRHGRLRRPRR